MTEYTTVLQSDLEAGDPWTATQAQAAMFNPLAMAEVDQTVIDAGIVVPGVWYPIEAATPSGIIWDHSVDGTAGTITSPTLETKFEYKMVLENFTLNGVNAQGALEMDVNLSSSGYTSNFELETVPTVGPFDATFDAVIHLSAPFRGEGIFMCNYFSNRAGHLLPTFNSSGQNILNVRLISTNASFTGGVVRMYKRRCFY